MVLWRLKMRKIFERALIVGLLAAVLTLQGGPVMAQDTYMADAEVDAIIQEFLPAGVSLGDATEDEIEQAIFDAVSSQPVAVLSIVRRAVQLRPEQAQLLLPVRCGSSLTRLLPLLMSLLKTPHTRRMPLPRRLLLSCRTKPQQ